jgi:hypothetical protein
MIRPQPPALVAAEALPMPDEFDEHDVLTRFTDLSPEIRPDRRLVRDLKRDLAPVQEALREVLKLVERPQGRYPLNLTPDAVSTILEVQEARTAAALLKLESFRRSEAGDTAGALLCDRACLNAAQSVGDEPFLVSQLVRMAICALAQQQLERTLAQGTATGNDLAIIQRMLEAEAADNRLLFGLLGELATWARIVDAVARGDIPLSALTRGVFAPPPTTWDKIVAMAERPLVRRWGAYLLRTLNNVIEISKLPPEQWHSRFQELDGEIGDPRTTDSLMAALLIPTIEKVATAELRTLAYLRTAVAAVAAERYRLTHGKWPAALDDLVNERFMAAVPVDPFDGKPLRLVKNRMGITVYSVGPDLTDDGGTIDRKNPNGPKSDIGFRLFDPACRRLSVELAPMPREP